MSRINEELDGHLQVLIGTGDLIQVRFSLYQVVLLFERMWLEVFPRCEIRDSNLETWVWNPEQISDMRGFAKLLESEICSYQVFSPDAVILRFTNGCELELRDDGSGFEIFVVHVGEKVIVV